MITIFACPKPFRDPHIATIQTNAITAWTMLAPEAEVILLGDEAGVSEIAGRLGVTHVPGVKTNPAGTPYLNDLFDQAERHARGDLLCYVNADIILLPDFVAAAKRVFQWRGRCLAIGTRTDVDWKTPIDFELADWNEKLEEFVKASGSLMPFGSDYFVFERGFFRHTPAFLVGRAGFDNWMIWYGRRRGDAVVNIGPSTLAIHQNHRKPGEWEQLSSLPESVYNRSLAGRWPLSYTPADATHQCQDGKIHSLFWKARLNRLSMAKDLAKASLRSAAKHLLAVRIGARSAE